MLLALYLLLVLFPLTILYFSRTFNYWKKKGVKGPTPVPFFGNLKESALRRTLIGTVLQNIYNDYPDEKIVGVYRMTTPCLLIRDLDIIKHVTIKDFDAFIDRGIEFSKEGLGANLFHADGETWRVLRNRFTPIFTSGKLKNMLYLITERGDDFIELLEKITVDQTEHEVYSLVQRYTTATIAACAFGLNLDTHNNNETVDILQKINNLIITINYGTELDMLYPGILKKINMSLFPSYVTKFFEDLVQNVTRQRNGRPSNRKDFMDLILEMKQEGKLHGPKKDEIEKDITLELTDSVIAAQAFVFFAAGYETSATTMAFMLYELAKNPDVQDKLIADIDKVLEQHNGKVTYEALQDMTYLQKVFDETLRKYPIVDHFVRCAQTDYKVPGTGVTIPKGTTVIISSLSIHFDPQYYPEPKKFDPERHCPENVGKMHPCSYLPFGIGPRKCIGMRFSKLQTKVCMVKFFLKFRVEASKYPETEVELSPNRIVLSPKNGIRLNIVRR